MQKISSRITNEANEAAGIINRVTYDISSKPPAHVRSTDASCFFMGPRWLIYPILSSGGMFSKVVINIYGWSWTVQVE